MPGQYTVEHVRFSSATMARDGLSANEIRALMTLDGIEQLICFGSGLGRWDAMDAVRFQDSLPDTWREPVMSGNARAILRWRS
jgi:hypothetical protein